MSYSAEFDGNPAIQPLLDLYTKATEQIREFKAKVADAERRRSKIGAVLEEFDVPMGESVHTKPSPRRQDRYAEILRVLGENDEMRSREILEAGDFGDYTREGVDKALNKLQERGEVTSQKLAGGARYWRLARAKSS